MFGKVGPASITTDLLTGLLTCFEKICSNLLQGPLKMMGNSTGVGVRGK